MPRMSGRRRITLRQKYEEEIRPPVAQSMGNQYGMYPSFEEWKKGRLQKKKK